MYYNLHVSPSITAMGRALISSAGMFFEGFLGCNVKFRSLDDIITFIHNVENEKPYRKYKDTNILNEDITVAECAYKLLTNCGFEFMVLADETIDAKSVKGHEYIPSEEDMNIVLDILYDLDQETINRLFYKNNLYTFMDNKTVEKAVIYLLTHLNTPMLDPNKAPKEIEVELNEFCEILKEYVYYEHNWLDKMERYRCMTRVVNALTDTDSCISSFDPIYHCVLEKVKGIDMKIKHESIDIITYAETDEFGDPKSLQEAIIFDEDKLDYDFYNDEIIEMKKLIDPLVIIPQESLRYSIINIFAYCVTDLINDYMVRFTQTSFSYEPDKECRIYMKNEFLFKTILLTYVMKNYMSLQEVQEGNIVPKDKQMDIKGMPIDKSTLQDDTRKRLQKIALEDILKCEEFDQAKIIKDLAIFEKQIFNNINSGLKDYYKPAKIRAYTGYDDPMRIMGVKAAVAYNELADEGMERIDLTQRNSLDILKVVINEKKIERLKTADPEHYEKVMSVLSKPEFKGEITSVAFPKDVIVPKWILEFANYQEIINNNLKSFPLDTIGIFRGNDNNNYSNIVQL